MGSTLLMKNENSLKHAEHNEKTCKYLSKKPDFADWVITTAFYSALHYTQYSIFPFSMEIRGNTINYQDFEAYYRNNNPAQINKHSSMSNLVEDKLPGYC